MRVENHCNKSFQNPKWFSVFLEAGKFFHVCMTKDLVNCKLVMIAVYLGWTQWNHEVLLWKHVLIQCKKLLSFWTMHVYICSCTQHALCSWELAEIMKLSKLLLSKEEFSIATLVLDVLSWIKKSVALVECDLWSSLPSLDLCACYSFSIFYSLQLDLFDFLMGLDLVWMLINQLIFHFP